MAIEFNAATNDLPVLISFQELPEAKVRAGEIEKQSELGISAYML